MLMIVMGRQANVYRRDEQKSRQAQLEMAINQVQEWTTVQIQAGEKREVQNQPIQMKTPCHGCMNY